MLSLLHVSWISHFLPESSVFVEAGLERMDFEGKDAPRCNFFPIFLFLMLLSSNLRRRQWHPTPVLLPGKSHGPRSLVGCSPWGHEESDTTEHEHESVVWIYLVYSLIFYWTLRLSHWRFLNILVHISIHFSKSEMAESWNSICLGFEIWPKGFTKWWTNLLPQQQLMRAVVGPHPHQHLISYHSFSSSHSGRCVFVVEFLRRV